MTALLAALAELRLLDAWALLLLPLVALAWWRTARARAPAAASAAATFLSGNPLPVPDANGAPPPPPLPRTWRQRLLALPDALHALGLVLAVVALARPVQRSPLPETTLGIDIVLALDVSSSMQATDLDAEHTRLHVARRAAADFIAARRHDRIGLVCFARYPDVRCPLTLDHAALRELLAEVELVAAGSNEDATGLGAALARASQLVRSSPAKSKVVVLLTDGEENVATPQTPEEIAPLHAAQLCAEHGVRAYTIAVGVGDRQPDGQMRQLDTTVLERVARRAGGRFFAAADSHTLRSVYAEIDALERAALAAPRYRVAERCVPFLLAAIALMLLARVLRATAFAVLP